MLLGSDLLDTGTCEISNVSRFRMIFPDFLGSRIDIRLGLIICFDDVLAFSYSCFSSIYLIFGPAQGSARTSRRPFVSVKDFSFLYFRGVFIILISTTALGFIGIDLYHSFLSWHTIEYFEDLILAFCAIGLPNRFRAARYRFWIGEKTKWVVVVIDLRSLGVL